MSEVDPQWMKLPVTIVERNSGERDLGSVSAVHHAALRSGINTIRDIGSWLNSFTGLRRNSTR
jgi:hypothetical protein